MVDIRGFNGGLNTDASPELLPNGAYTYAMNISNGSEGIVNLPGNALIPNLPASVGNSTEWVCGSFFDKKRQRVILFTNNERGYHRILSYNVSSEAYTLLYLENPSPTTGLGTFNWTIYSQFNPEGLIKDIKVVHRETEGDLYYFVGPDKKLYKFNYDTILDWTTNNTPVKLEYFNVIKAPPKDIIEVDIIDDVNYRINNLYKKLFQFKYRFIYDDNEKSVWSGFSKVPLPAKSTDPLYNALSNVQNVIELKFDTGDINVAKIEIAGRINIEGEWSDFFLVDTIDKQRDGVSDNIVLDYTFRNDSVYIPIDIQESNLLFDYVPDEVNALELANGNTLVIGGLKDGYDRDLELDVTIENKPNTNSPAVPSTINATSRNASNTSSFTPTQFNANKNVYLEYVAGIILFDGTPQVGDVITVTIAGKNRRREYNWIGESWQTDTPFNESWSVTFESGWSIVDLIDGFINHSSRPYPFNITTDRGLPLVQSTPSSRPTNPFGRPLSGSIANALYFGSFGFDMKEWWFDSVSIKINRSFSFGDSDVFPTYKWSGVYKFGLVYYSKDGKTNGVFTNNKLSLQTAPYKTDYIWTASTEDLVIPENETAQLYIGHTPPAWADYYHIVRTKELSCDFSLMVISCNTRKSGGYLYLDIENIKATNTAAKETSKVINYGTTTFVDGDRVRILQKYNSTTGQVSWDTKEFLDLPILAVENSTGSPARLELKLKDIDTSDFPNVITVNTGDKFVIEIYRPAKVLSDEDLVYYEVGHKYNILTDSNGNRYHDGTQVVDNVVYWTYGITGFVRFLNSPSGPVPFFASSFFATGANLDEIQINSSRNENDRVRQNIKAGDYIEIDNTLSNDGIYLVTNVIQDSDNRTTIIVDLNFNAPSPETKRDFTIKRVSPPSASGKIAVVNMFNDGDYYFKTRTMIKDTGTANFGALFVAEKNFSETFLSAVWSQGRPLIVDENIKEEYFPAMLRFSQSYIYGTNINNLNRFYPNNFEEADASFGDILRLKTRENFIRLFQRFKTGMIPIYRQIIIDNAASSQVALSERLLNKPNYYNGEYGIDKYGSSLVSTDYGDYFIDTDNKAIVRASLDGITNVSDNNNLSVWANANIKEDSYGLGCFNYENRNVIILVGHIDVVPNNTIIAYSESDKNFESYYGFTDAETMLFINGFVYTGYNGALYIHNSPVRNNFYGVQQNSSITTIFNGGLQLKKTYTAIEELANGLWTGTISTGPLTNQTTNVSAADFQKTVGAYTINSKENKFNATIKRDQNSPGGKFQGAPMKGLYAQVALTNSLSSEQRLISVSLKYIQSPLTNS